jgi:hypothetical protein
MEKFQDVVIDPSGNALAGVTVLVRAVGSVMPATLFTDNAKTPLVNPLTTDANGHFFFYAEQGRYSLDLSGGGVTPKTVSDLWVDDVIYARLDSPAFTGTPTAPTPALTDSTIKIATTAFAAGLMSAHVATADPHPIYMTRAEVEAKSGGTVTQLTSKTTAVTLNKNTGEITLAAGMIQSSKSISFNFNNLTVNINDNVVLNLKAGSSAYSGVYQIWAENIGNGICDIVVHNVSGSSYDEALKLQFTVLKGAIA